VGANSKFLPRRVSNYIFLSEGSESCNMLPTGTDGINLRVYQAKLECYSVIRNLVSLVALQL
jgi:hypothetical protein